MSIVPPRISSPHFTHLGTLKNNLFVKNWYIFSICLNFSHLQSILHLMQYTYQDVFSTAQNSFWTCRFWCLLVLLLFFASPLSHRQNISLWGLFSSRETNKKKISRGETVEQGGWSIGVMLFFGQKLLNTQHSVGRCAGKSPKKWVNMFESSKKKITETQCSLSQKHQLVHWYRWVPRSLT